MEIWMNGHTAEINAMSEEFKLDLVNELKGLHQQVAKLWQANSTLQRELLERASKIESELVKISVGLDRDGDAHRGVAEQVVKSREKIEEDVARISKLETSMNIIIWVVGLVATGTCGLIVKLMADWVVK